MSDTTLPPGTPNDDPSTPAPARDVAADPLRDLLTRVAAGEVDPAEAARLLDEDTTAPTVDRPTTVATDSSSVGSLSVLAGGVRLTVIADPSVATAVADGPHSVRQEGSTLVVEAPSTDGYQVREAPKYLSWVPTVWTSGRGERVTVRVNPDLPLLVQATACSVDISGVHADLTVNADAASVKVREHRGAVHGTARMCSVSIVGAVTGDSAFVCEFGSVNLRLDRGSDVVVSAVSEMGTLKLGGDDVSQDESGMRMRGTTGAGSHSFALTVRMGSATVVAA